MRPLCRMLGIDPALLGEAATPRRVRRDRRAAGEPALSGEADQGRGSAGDPPAPSRRRRTRRGKEGEPSAAEIMKIINTRRWPSIEMQADPKKYPWYPADSTGTGDEGEKSG